MTGEVQQQVSHGGHPLDSGRAETFGRLLRAHRIEAGLSQSALAKRAGLGERVIQRLEADNNRPYRATVEQIVKALGLAAEQRAALIAAVPPRSRTGTRAPTPPIDPPTPHLRIVRPASGSGRPAGAAPIAPSSPPAERRVHQAAPLGETSSAPVRAEVPDLASPAETPDLAPRTPTARAFQARRGRLIGRESDARAVRDVLLQPDVGLVTLTGPGGSGKTRLAIQVAADLADQFEDGVTFVNLTLIAEPAAVAMTIVQALDLVELGDQSPGDRLKRHLQHRHALLLLDNFEHVLAARTLVADLLDACPRLAVLVTSRAVLRIYGEREILVPPLDRPPDEGPLTLDAAARFPAVKLFVERTQAVRPDFTLTEENVGAVVAICQRLDGLPLAIELAAARGRLLGPRAMLARLEQRLTLLTDGPRDRPARQQTLRGAIGWSYDLLEDEERRMFRRLGVFVGGCTLDAGLWVIGDGDAKDCASSPMTYDLSPMTLDLVGSLVDKSLVIPLSDLDGEPRFGMLETIREFAVEQFQASGESAQLRQRHADYYLALAERAAPCLTTAEQVAWLARLDAEHANIGAALTWLLAQDDQDLARRALRLAGALHWYWWLGGAVAEGYAWIRASLARVRPDEPLAAPARAQALYAAGGLAMVQGEYLTASDLLDEVIELYRQLGDRQGLSRALTYRSIVYTYAVDHRAARANLLEALQLLHEVDDRWGLGLAGSNLGAVTRSLGDPDGAHRLLEEYVPVARETGDRYLLGTALPKWAHVATARGDPDQAEAFVREALGLFRPFNDGWWTARCLNLLTVMAAERGDHLRAARLLGAAEHLLHMTGARLVPTDEARSSRMSELLRAQLGEAQFDAARAEGGNAAVEQVVHYAIDTTAEHLTPPSSSPAPR